MEDYAQLLLITQRKKLQEYIDDTHDMDGLVAWYNKTKARIESLDAAIEALNIVRMNKRAE